MLLAMASSKEKLVNVRLTPKVHEEFKVACELKGASMSSLMHQFIVRTIREEKEREPQAFILTPLPATLNLPKGTLESIDHHKIPKETLPNAKRKNSKA